MKFGMIFYTYPKDWKHERQKKGKTKQKKKEFSTALDE